jgi:cobalt/nickel transport system permease protein
VRLFQKRGFQVDSFQQAVRHLQTLEDFASIRSPIHSLHPVTKISVTFLYILALVSFGRTELFLLLPFLAYPLMVLPFSDLPVIPILKRLLVVEPFIILVALFNPIIDRSPMLLAGIVTTRGWLVFFTLLLKGTLAVFSALILVSTTGLSRIAAGLSWFKVPSLIILQLLMTFRYISLLAEEVSKVNLAFALRNRGNRALHPSVWGSFLGHILLRTVDRAERIHSAMLLRGFDAKFSTGATTRFGVADAFFLLGWGTFFALFKFADFSTLIASKLGGI